MLLPKAEEEGGTGLEFKAVRHLQWPYNYNRYCYNDQFRKPIYSSDANPLAVLVETVNQKIETFSSERTMYLQLRTDRSVMKIPGVHLMTIEMVDARPHKLENPIKPWLRRSA